MIRIDLQMNKSVKPFTNTLDMKYIRAHTKTKSEIAADQCGGSGSGGGDSYVVSPVDSSKLPNTNKCFNDQITSKATTKDKFSYAMASNDRDTSVDSEPKNIVEKIIADFAECESDVVMMWQQPQAQQQQQQQQKPQRQQQPAQMQQQKSKQSQTQQHQQQQQKQQQPHQPQSSRKNSTPNNFNELIITCRNNIDKPLNATSSTKVRLLNHRSNRIISRSVSHLKNSITKVDFGTNQGQTTNASTTTAATTTIPGGSSLLNKNLDKAAKAYEFSEDNEKCEKISTFRKRRLADKKYEFCEDNTENIIPYNRMRSVIRTPTLHQKISRHSPAAQSNVMSYSSSPPSTFDISTSFHTHRASPSYPGFRSPCGSPVGNRFLMMSPPGRFHPEETTNFQSHSLNSLFYLFVCLFLSDNFLFFIYTQLDLASMPNHRHVRGRQQCHHVVYRARSDPTMIPF